jgi:hypothetical protein
MFISVVTSGNIKMAALEKIRNSLIDQIMASENEDLLQAVYNIFDSTQENKIVSLSSEQIEMLMMSEEDIDNNRLISEEELDEFEVE